MGRPWSEVRETLEAVLEAPPGERETRLHELAGDDAELAREVGELLRHEAFEDFLDRPAAEETGAPAFVDLDPGQRIASYELVRRIGAGGMGTVWEARQEAPQRRVALKTLVPGTRGWSRTDIWRFGYEARVLANLKHPNVAQVYEAGSTKVAGRDVLWIAMELIEGSRDLLRWVRELSPPRDVRLRLFETLCEAVQHGHQRGVIHRDIKPSNVLVTEVDGRSEPMLIDFGIARAVDGGGGGGTPSLRTHTGELLGTLEYMAPEQIEGRTDLDVRCDVYALGVVLYELLCDASPLDVAGKPLPEVAEVIRYQEPRPPSEVDPSLAGDLEHIVLAALEKERTRRYPSPADLAEDLRRHRRDEPVLARPASAGYRLLKFVRRNRVAALLSTAVLLGLVATATGTTVGLVEAREAEERAVEEEGKAREALGEARRQEEIASREAAGNREMVGLLKHVFEDLDATRLGRETRVVDMLRTADLDWSRLDGLDPKLAFEFHLLIGQAYIELGWEQDAAPHMERAVELAELQPERVPEEDLLRLRARLALALSRTGRADEAGPMLRALADVAAGIDDVNTRLQVGHELLKWLADRKDFAELIERAGAQVELAAAAGDDEDRLDAQELLAYGLGNMGRGDEAVAVLEGVLRETVELNGERDRRVLELFASLADAQQNAGRYDDAEASYEEAAPLFLEVFGTDSAQTLDLLNNRAALLVRRRDFDGAAERFREVVAACEAGAHANTIRHVVAVHNVGSVLQQAGRSEEAEPHLRRSVEMAGRILTDDDFNLVQMRFNVGACLASLRRFDEAEPILLACWERIEAVLPAGHPLIQSTIRTIADSYELNGDPEAAASWRERLDG